MMMLIKKYFSSVLILVAIVFIASTASGTGREENITSLFYQANGYYEQGNYEKAVETYEKILDNGYTSGNIYYNLANSYYRLGNKGYALANYLRARYFTPGDPDLRSNLNYLKKDLQLTDGNTGIIHWFSNYFTLNELLMVTTIIFFLLVLMVLLYQYLPQFQRGLGIPIILMVIFWGCLLLGTGIGLYHHLTSNPAIVVVEEAQVRFEPSTKGEVHFQVPLGSKLEIDDVREGWVVVHRDDGKKGWISQDDIVSLKLN